MKCTGDRTGLPAKGATLAGAQESRPLLSATGLLAPHDAIAGPCQSRMNNENATTGDPYLNLVAAWILRRRQYPAYFRHQGLVGTASFLMTWARNGEIVWLELIISSGNSAIDLYAEDMIRSSSPLPPMPANRPGPAMTVKVDFPVAP